MFCSSSGSKSLWHCSRARAVCPYLQVVRFTCESTQQLRGMCTFHASFSECCCLGFCRTQWYRWLNRAPVFQCKFSILSAPPEVEHLFRVHPTLSLSTMTVSVCILQVSQRKLSTHRCRPLRCRAILLTSCELHSEGFEASRITSFDSNAASYLISFIHWHSSAKSDRLDGFTCPRTFSSTSFCRHCILASRRHS